MDIAFHILAGFLLGGLVNVLADNLPQSRFLAPPRYHDGTARPLVAWLGLGAFLFDRRRSRHAGQGDSQERLSWRYPLTELALAGLLLATHLVAGSKPQVSLGQQLLWQFFVIVFVLLAVVDIEHQRILFLPVFAVSLLAIFGAAFYPQHSPNLPSSLVGGVAGGVVFSLVYAGGLVYRRSLGTRRDIPTAFGKGDIYLMAMGGLVVGFPNALVTMLAAVFLGGAGALAWLVGSRRRGRRYEPFTALPYGPYILTATYAVMIFPGGISLGF